MRKIGRNFVRQQKDVKQAVYGYGSKSFRGGGES